MTPTPPRPPPSASKRIGNERVASRVTLPAVLRLALATLYDPRRSRSHDANKNAARRVLNQFLTRYTITLDNEHQESP